MINNWVGETITLLLHGNLDSVKYQVNGQELLLQSSLSNCF
jgi:hypothetical protein